VQDNERGRVNCGEEHHLPNALEPGVQPREEATAEMMMVAQKKLPFLLQFFLLLIINILQFCFYL
jgi:hypothetical protein